MMHVGISRKYLLQLLGLDGATQYPYMNLSDQAGRVDDAWYARMAHLMATDFGLFAGWRQGILQRYIGNLDTYERDNPCRSHDPAP